METQLAAGEPEPSDTPLAAAANLLPSAEQATDTQLALPVTADHDAPELLENSTTPPLTAANNLVPSAEEATETQLAVPEAVTAQFPPEFV